MASYILKQDVEWLESLPMSEPSGTIVLLGGDGCQVVVPAVLLLAASPLARIILSDHLPPSYSPIVISIPTVTEEVLKVVGLILATGAAAYVTEETMDKVEEVFKALEIVESLVVDYIDVSKVLEMEIFIKEEGDIIEENNATCDPCERGTSGLENQVLEIEQLMEAKGGGRTDEKIFIKSQQKVQIVRGEEGKLKVRGLWPGQQLIQLPDGKLKIFSSHQEASSDAGSIHTRGNSKGPRLTSLSSLGASSTEKASSRTGNVCARFPPIEDPSRPFGCSHCPKRFLRKNHPKEHVLIHSGEMPFSCHLCLRRFNRSRELKKHLKLHPGSLSLPDMFQQEEHDFS